MFEYIVINGKLNLVDINIRFSASFCSKTYLDIF